MKTIAVETLGCRLNLFESDGIVGQFLATGNYRVTDLENQPDVVIINTCTVTDKADQKNRHIIVSARKKNPNAKILVTGCYAQTDPDEIRKIPGVDLVVGNDRKSDLQKIFESLDTRTQLESQPSFEGSGAFGFGYVMPQGHTRAYLKIQDGCDRKCTYCKIPQARGKGQSRSLGDILNHIKYLEEQGVPEVVLTGVNLGWYRSDGIRFGALVQQILSNLSRMRLRLSSIEPCDVDEELAELTLHPLFCDFLHVPLQSGSREILKKMRRTYNPDSFRKRIEKVLSINPDVFIGTDVIVGFPGESESEFQESVDLCRELHVAKIHAFPFSSRRGTLAAEFEDRVPENVMRHRMNVLKAVSDAGFNKYANRFVGKRRKAVIEKVTPEYTEGLTDNFIRVRLDTSELIQRGQTLDVEIESVSDRFCYSRPL